MPIILRPINQDEAFAKARIKIVINDLPNKSEENRQYFNRLASETYETDLFSVMPRCACPDDQGLKGEHLLGETCMRCGMEVKSMLQDDIESTLWIRRPVGVAKLISPMFWIMFNKRFTHGKFSIPQWLIDRGYNPRINKTSLIQEITDSGIQRGYNHFVQNFDSIVDYLFSFSKFKAKKASVSPYLEMLGIDHPSKDPLRQWIEDFRPYIFSDYLPVPNKMFLVIEKSALGTWVDDPIFLAKDAINTMFSVDQDYYDQSTRTLENRTGKIVCKLADFYATIYKEHLSPKKGHLRKQLYGSRTNFSFRAVITSHDRIAKADEIHIPWGIGVTCFNLHLKNRLMDPNLPYGNMTLNQATAFLTDHVYRYHPMLDRLFQDLINESPNKAIPCLMHRN